MVCAANGLLTNELKTVETRWPTDQIFLNVLTTDKGETMKTVQREILKKFKKGTQAQIIVKTLSGKNEPVPSKILKDKSQASNIADVVRQRINPILIPNGLIVTCRKEHNRPWKWLVESLEEVSKA